MFTYRDALAYLENLQIFGIKLGLEQTSELLEAAGSPQKKLNLSISPAVTAKVPAVRCSMPLCVERDSQQASILRRT